MNSIISFFRNGRLVLGSIMVSVALAALIVYTNQGASLTSTTSGKVMHTAHNLKNAISAYFTEHRSYPAFDSTYDTDLNTDFHLMDVLVGADYTLKNRKLGPRRIAFFTEKEATPGEDGTNRNGLSKTPDGRSELWDPWGNHYRVRLDTNRDNLVGDPTGGAPPLPESILVWSAGPDGDFATWSDNVKTW